MTLAEANNIAYFLEIPISFDVCLCKKAFVTQTRMHLLFTNAAMKKSTIGEIPLKLSVGCCSIQEKKELRFSYFSDDAYTVDHFGPFGHEKLQDTGC